MELTIGKETIRSGEKKNLTLPVTEKTHLPLTVICGKRPGKTALISAAFCPLGGSGGWTES